MASEKWKKIVTIAIIVFSIIILLIGFLVGIKGLKDFFTFLFIGLLVITILFGIGYVIYLLFIRKEFKDIPAQFRKKLHSVTKVMDNKMLGNLFLSGDSKHNRINLGKFFYLRINLPKIVSESSEDKMSEQSKSEAVPVDCFVVQKTGIMNKFFGDPFFVLVKPSDHDYSSIFNDVTINGFNLVPLDSEFFTIDRRNLDLDLVKGLALNYIRESVYDLMKELDRLVKQAMKLDTTFQKEKERAREFEIPSMGGFGDKK